MIHEVFKGVESLRPEYSLDESEPAIDFVHAVFGYKDLHFIEHPAAMAEAAACRIEDFVVGIIKWVDSPLFECCPIGSNYFSNFFRRHAHLFFACVN